MSTVYRNRLTINQRGGSLDIDNTTESEKVKLSQRSGSNINMTNVVTSELATNNKQTKVIHDSYESIGNDKAEFVGGEKHIRIGETIYNLKGFKSESELEAFKEWKEIFKEIAYKNSQFKIARSGYSYPNGPSTPASGSRGGNPVIGSTSFSIQNTSPSQTGTPIVNSSTNEVQTYATVGSYETNTSSQKSVDGENVLQAAGSNGSSAPGVIDFGPYYNASTEGGSWDGNSDTTNIEQAIIDLQPKLLEAEKKMGEGGDEIELLKRNKFEQVGAVFNDYPSVRIDPKGRSQPLEMLVSNKGPFINYDAVSLIEEIDNSSSFPCGNDDKVVCNRYSRSVGSGGIQLKTTGNTELGGTTLKTGFKRIDLNASNGVVVASEEFIELQSLKSITLRTNRQVYVESALGVKGNVIVGGGLSVEGEIFCNHITAPLEIQETELTELYGKFNTESAKSLAIGEVYIHDQGWTTVFALPSPNLIRTYPHSHHFHNLPLRLTGSNNRVRELAANEGINTHNTKVAAQPLLHERKEKS